MGKRIGASGRGRYEEKGGGQQVGSLFAEATGNERLKAIYGNYNLWSWLRYWWLDTENWVTFMLMDKGYYDYDYSEPKPKREIKPRTAKQMSSILERFGFKTKLKEDGPKRITAEELQAEVMAEEEKKRATPG